VERVAQVRDPRLIDQANALLQQIPNKINQAETTLGQALTTLQTEIQQTVAPAPGTLPAEPLATPTRTTVPRVRQSG
jgi:hypothetical protein